MSVERAGVGCLLGGFLGTMVAVGLGLLMSDHNLSAYELSFLLALPAGPGGAVIGAILPWAMDRLSARGGGPQRSPGWGRAIAISVAVPLLGGAVGGAIFLFLAGLQGGVSDALQASAGGAGLGLVFGFLSLPVSAPLSLVVVRALSRAPR